MKTTDIHMPTAQVTIVSVKPDAKGLDVTWSVSPAPDDGSVQYFAAAPATRGASFEGSGLPFANETQAFQGGSKGRVVASQTYEGNYNAQISMPNAYYVGLGTRYVPPALHVTYVSGGKTYKGIARVADGVPFRKLTYHANRTGPEFYSAHSLVRSQQDILFANAYNRF
jgi:hypothetical protein